MNLEVEKSKDGYRIQRVEVSGKVKYIGSKYNQRNKIDNFINQFEIVTERDNIIIFGLAFAEHIKELLSMIFDENNILIIELNKELLEYSKNDDEIVQILKDSRINLAYNEKDIICFFEQYIDESNIEYLKCYDYCDYCKIYNEKLIRIFEVIRNKTDEILSNTIIHNNMKKNYLNNILHKLKYIVYSSQINELKDKFKNRTAIIVSAGPSLSKNLYYLSKIDNAAILTGGRPLNSIIENNINPTLIASIDGSDVSYKLVEQSLGKVNCPFVYSETTNNKILDNYNKEADKIFLPLEKFFENFFDIESSSKMFLGGSIAHVLTGIAIYLGFTRIVFIGQDLAYTNNQGHDINAQNYWENLTFDNFYKNENDLYVESIDGKKVRTSLLLNSYRIQLERIIIDNPQIEFINATEGGALIHGAKNKKLSEVLEEVNKESKIDINQLNLSYRNINQKIITELKNQIKKMRECRNLIEKGERSIRCFEKSVISKNIDKKKTILNRIFKYYGNVMKSCNSGRMSIITPIIAPDINSILADEKYVINSLDSIENIEKKKVNMIAAIFSSIDNTIANSCCVIENTIQKLINIE